MGRNRLLIRAIRVIRGCDPPDERHDFGMSFPGSMNGFFTTVAARSPLSGRSTVNFEPSSAEHRYSAASAAALAGCGQGKDANAVDAKELARLRQQALDWLRADLAAWSKLLEKDAGKIGAVQEKMRGWLSDTDFKGVRGSDALAKLPETERAGWQQLWKDLEALRQRAMADADKLQAILATKPEAVFNGTLKREQAHELEMKAGRTYVIDMESAQFDTYLKLQDPSGKLLAENDDIAPDNLNSRIIFTAKKDGTYRIIGMSFQQGDQGEYTLTVRSAAEKK